MIINKARFLSMRSMFNVYYASHVCGKIQPPKRCTSWQMDITNHLRIFSYSNIPCRVFHNYLSVRYGLGTCMPYVIKSVEHTFVELFRHIPSEGFFLSAKFQSHWDLCITSKWLIDTLIATEFSPSNLTGPRSDQLSLTPKHLGILFFSNIIFICQRCSLRV